MYRVVPCIVAILCYNVYAMKKAITVEAKPRIRRKGIVAKTESSNHKHSKNYVKRTRGQGKTSKRRKSNG